MTRNDDFIGHLEGYLDEYEGSTPLPHEVRDAIRAQLPSTTQRAAWWPARRFPEMNNTAKLALAAAAVVVVALLGVNYLVAPNVGGRGLGDATPTPEPTVLTPSNVGQTLAPGTYRVEDTFAKPFTFAIETAWILEFLETDVVSLNRADDPGADWLDIQLIDNVYTDPCAGELSDPPVPKTHDGLIRALSAMVGFEAGPITDVTVGGRAGSHVVVMNAMDGDADGCVTGNSIPIYTTMDNPDDSITNGNSRDEFWIVDVDGSPVILHGLITRSSNEAADIAETEKIVETITFD